LISCVPRTSAPLAVEIDDRIRPFLASDRPGANGWWDAHCPLHNDSKRSAGFNFDKNIWSCRAGCGKGKITDLMAMMGEDDDNYEGSTGLTGGFDDSAVVRRGKDVGRPAPTPLDIDRWCEALEHPGRHLYLVEERGIYIVTLRAHRVGWSDEESAYTIPVYDEDGDLRNVRLYNPNKPRTKIWNWGGEGMDPNQLFPARVLKENDSILICEGEWDCLLANDRGFPAVTGTTGAMQWMPKWNRKFTDKSVVLMYDRDDTGVAAAGKVSRELDGIAHSIAIAELPLPFTKKHGQDVTDFFVTHKKNAEEFASVIRNASVVSAPKDGAATRVSVLESYNPKLSGQKMEMVVSVVGKGLHTHLVPREVLFSCDMAAGTKCHGCPMADTEGLMTEEVPADSPVLLKMRDVPTAKRDEAIRDHFGIHKCGPHLSIDVRSWMTTETLLVRTSIEEETEEDDHRSRTLVNVGEYRTPTNNIVRVTGTTYPSPAGQESVFQSWDLSHVEESLDRYEVTPEDIELMKRFRTNGDPMKKLGDIARYMALNVTRIYERTLLHIAMDLVFHSALTFSFAGEVFERGWLELLVVGDARTGKSEVATKLCRHYGYGRVISCEAASIPGLLGAVKPMPGSTNKGWTLEWGAIPLNDRRLLALDEFTGLSVEQIGQLSGLRSSGLAEIIKAEREITRARTRLIWMGNPRDNVHGMETYMYGVNAIAPAVGTQEDIARFDFAMTVSTGDVSSDKINKRRSPGKPAAVYSYEACHTLISWVWSRGRDQIKWDEEAEEAVFASAMDLGERYVPDPPLIQMQNVRVKVARLAVAIAARTFSTTKDYQSILVQKRHVVAAVRLLDHMYGLRSFGYGEVSRRAMADRKEATSNKRKVGDYLLGRPELARALIRSGGIIRFHSFCEMLNYGDEEGRSVINNLSSMGMIGSDDGHAYRLTRELNDVLRDMEV
jgi:hypothetical protein